MQCPWGHRANIISSHRADRADRSPRGFSATCQNRFMVVVTPPPSRDDDDDTHPHCGRRPRATRGNISAGMRQAKRMCPRHRRRHLSYSDDVTRPSLAITVLVIVIAFALVGGAMGRMPSSLVVSSWSSSSFVTSPSTSAMGGGWMMGRRASSSSSSSSSSSHLLVSSVRHSSGTAASSGGERRRDEDDDIEKKNDRDHRDDASSRTLGDGSSPPPPLPLPTTPISSNLLIGRLDSFAYNIGKRRRMRRDVVDRGPGNGNNGNNRARKREIGEYDDALIDACNSLVHFLRDESRMLHSCCSILPNLPPPYSDDGDDDDAILPRSAEDSLEMALNLPFTPLRTLYVLHVSRNWILWRSFQMQILRCAG